MSLAVLESVLKSRDMNELARPLLAAPRPFRGLNKPGYPLLTNTVRFNSWNVG